MGKFLFFIFSFFSVTSFGLDPSKRVTQYVLECWGKKEGLPTYGSYSVIQGLDGYIYIATEGGFVSFDGVNFKVANKSTNPEFKANFIRSLYMGRDGSIFATTIGGGVLKYKDGIFKIYSVEEGLSSDNVFSFLEDKKGRYFFGTSSGLDILEGDKFSYFGTTKDFPLEKVRALFEGEDGEIYIGCDGGIHILKEGKIKLISKFKDEYPREFIKLKNGSLILLTSKNIYILENEKIKKFEINEELGNKSMETILEDKDGNLWIGTRNNGVYKICKERVENLSLKEGLPDLWVRDFCEDREGNLWISLNAGGICQLKDMKFKSITEKDGLPSNQVWQILEDKKGRIWMRAINGFAVKEGEKILNLSEKIKGEITSFAEDKDGNIWAFVYGKGFYILKELQIYKNLFFEELKNLSISAMYLKKDGSLLLGSSTGPVYEVYKERIKFVEGSEKILRVRQFFEDMDGNLWAGTDNGVFEIVDGVAKKVKNGNEDFNEIIYSIYQDGDGDLWFGSLNKGIFLYREGKFYNLSKEKGLFDDLVPVILEDGEGNFWTGSNNGIFSFSINDAKDVALGKKEKIFCKNYGIKDGMRTEECNAGLQPSALKSREGLFYFPTMEGVVVVDPKNIKINKVIPPVSIEEISLDNKIYKKPFPLNFEAGTKRIKFSFTLLSFMFPQENKFKYILEGYDKEWIDNGGRREAYYMNIPPKKYVFKVIGCNSDGIWNEEGASLSFYIKPFFYQTIYFKMFVLILVLFLIFSFVRFRVHQLKKRSEELEKIISEKTKELKEEKERSENLLLNILPFDIVEELKLKGFSTPRSFQSVTIMFTDFKGFTTISSTLPPEALVDELNDIYSNFDEILKKYKIEKIRVLGDSYMVVSGLPIENKDHAINCIKAAIEMQDYLKKRNERSAIKWQMRVGIHSGQVVAGIVGRTKFTYDVWGDAVNIAARMEQTGEPEKINISAFTYYLVKELVEVEYRGKVNVKGKGEVDMYFVKGIKNFP